MVNYLKNKYIKNTIIIASFFLIAVMTCLILFVCRFWLFGYDGPFHWQRFLTFKNNIFSNYDLNSTMGSAVMSFYPKLNLVSISILSIFIKNTWLLLYANFIFQIFIGLNIAYYTCQKYTKKFLVSYIFAFVFMTAMPIINWYFGLLDLGLITAYLFLPLVLFGTLNFIEKNEYIELAIGLTLIFMSHILTFVFASLFVFIFFLFNVHNFKLVDYLNILKISFLVLCTNAFYWLMIVRLEWFNQINKPHFQTLQGFPESTMYIEKNGLVQVLIIMGLGIFFFEKFSKINKQIYLVTVIITILSSRIIPWHLLDHTPVGVIQFPTRFMILALLTTSYLIAVMGSIVLKSMSDWKIYFAISALAILCMNLYNQWGTMNTAYFSSWGSKVVNNRLVSYRIDNGKHIKVTDIDTGDFADYVPKSNLMRYIDVYYHTGYDEEKNPIIFNANGNGELRFNNDALKKRLHLPFIGYKGQQYNVSLNGKKVNYYLDKEQVITIKNVSKGVKTIKITLVKGLIDYLAYILTAMGLLTYLFIGFKYLLKNYLKVRK
ncbi:6-pyruvoyl-tetrahydropterin synthase-related protein [Apilactobacillus xinyiensis]|uniref:6-pyruvoyl-tetrahydropterin synthase-related protein n=1 Tax=Apilactobacillus xinyiensis TaxID=2841032 RepID=UPI00200F33E8|nr:6-pyruvoyl-tetrahydropterin synthase-related protein [Apilactobacillus xinyiensis]MCL0330238.1 hypothetical protein [Apilactobacillus xinyiensis]